jgi:hypothetical protein
MSHMDDDLRELLQRKADDIPPHHEVPRSLVGRARRRIALNALAVGLTVVVVAGGALAGLRTFGAASNQIPVGMPTTSTSLPSTTASPSQPSPSVSPSPSPSVSPSPSLPTITACTSAQVRAVGSMQGAAGSREGGIRFENLSDKTCTLRGTPTITLLDQNLKPITSGVTFGSSPPGWVVDGLPEPAGWPVVTIHTGEYASVRIRWSNWCPDGRAAPLWRVAMPGGGTVDVNGLDAVTPPPCNGPGQPSTIEEGPFEPGPGL